MFIVALTYTAPLDVVDGLLADHRAWLDQGLAEGWLQMAGRKEPRDGGILIARGDNRADVEMKARTDPFFIHGATTFEVIEFLPVRAAAGVTLESLLA